MVEYKLCRSDAANEVMICGGSMLVMIKVLFTIQSYPSVRSANVLCDTNVIKELQRRGGYDISCLVFGRYNRPDFEVIDGVKVYRFRRSRFWNMFNYARDHSEDRYSAFIGKLNRFIMRLRQIIYIPIYPIYEPWLALKFAREAERLHKRERFDLVISEHNGYETLYAGHKLKQKHPEIKFIPIFWDPIFGKSPAKYLPYNYAIYRSRVTEKLMVTNADAVVSMTSLEKFHEDVKADKRFFDKYFYIGQPRLVAPDIEYLPSNTLDKTKINLIYSGILGKRDRDPMPFMNMLAQTSIADKLSLYFFIKSDCAEELRQFAESFAGEIAVCDYIPIDELHCIYNEADAFINFGGNEPNMTPSKIFEFMSFGKPIISTYHIDGDAGVRYLERYPLSLLVDERKAVIDNVAALNKFFTEKTGGAVGFDEVAALFPDCTPGAYADVIQKVIDDGEK